MKITIETSSSATAAVALQGRQPDLDEGVWGPRPQRAGKSTLMKISPPCSCPTAAGCRPAGYRATSTSCAAGWATAAGVRPAR